VATMFRWGRRAKDPLGLDMCDGTKARRMLQEVHKAIARELVQTRDARCGVSTAWWLTPGGVVCAEDVLPFEGFCIIQSRWIRRKPGHAAREQIVAPDDRKRVPYGSERVVGKHAVVHHDAVAEAAEDGKPDGFMGGDRIFWERGVV
jgi:hypothetical protein